MMTHARWTPGWAGVEYTCRPSRIAAERSQCERYSQEVLPQCRGLVPQPTMEIAEGLLFACRGVRVGARGVWQTGIG